MFDFLRFRAAQVATVVLLLQAAIYYSASRTETIPPTPPWSAFPAALGGFAVIGESLIEPEILDRLKPDDYINRSYANATSRESASLFIGYFKTQRKGLAPHSPKACLPGAGWQPVSSEVRSIRVTNGPPAIPVNLFVVEKGDTRLLVLYWYQQGERSFSNEILAQIYAVPQLLFHGRTDVALVRIITPIRDRLDPQSTEATAVAFAQAVYSAVRSHIP